MVASAVSDFSLLDPFLNIWIGHHGHDQVMVWDCHDGANQKFWMHEP